MNQTASKKHKNIPLLIYQLNIPLLIYQLDPQNTTSHLTGGSNFLANNTIQVYCTSFNCPLVLFWIFFVKNYVI